MLRAVGSLVTLGLAGLGVTHVMSQPPSVSAAGEHLKTVQTQIRKTGEVANIYARHIGDAVASPDRASELPVELQNFVKTGAHLSRLRDRLVADIAEYHSAYNAKLVVFDHEAGSVQDPATGRSLATLRRHTEDDVLERLANAQATIDDLDRVLAKGLDLQHAANAVLIADQLHQTGEDLDDQLTVAKTQASQYAATTTELLARVNNALTE